MPYIIENEWTTASISTWINLKNKILSTKSNKVCILYNSVCINFRTKILIYGEYIGGKIKTKGMINREEDVIKEQPSDYLITFIAKQGCITKHLFHCVCVCVCVCV